MESVQATQQNPSIETMLRGRTEVLELRFEVAAVQIVERLRIRAKNLNKILEEDLEVGSRLLSVSPSAMFMGLEQPLRDRRSALEQERRSEDKECWRDLTTVIRDLLNSWEGLTQARAKEQFIQAMPEAPMEPSPETVAQFPVDPDRYRRPYHNGNY